MYAQETRRILLAADTETIAGADSVAGGGGGFADRYRKAGACDGDRRRI
jgi:hypothetical protein